MGIVAEEILLKTIKTLIEETRRNIATVVNSSLTLMYWHIGKKINDELLGNERAKYGENIVSALGGQLKAEYGDGFSAKNLRHMIN